MRPHKRRHLFTRPGYVEIDGRIWRTNRRSPLHHRLARAAIVTLAAAGTIAGAILLILSAITILN